MDKERIFFFVRFGDGKLETNSQSFKRMCRIWIEGV